MNLVMFLIGLVIGTAAGFVIAVMCDDGGAYDWDDVESAWHDGIELGRALGPKDAKNE